MQPHELDQLLAATRDLREPAERDAAVVVLLKAAFAAIADLHDALADVWEAIADDN